MRFALIEQACNRLALLIVVLFVPLWTTLAYTVVPSTPLRFRIRPVGRTVVMDGNILLQINGALQALSLVIAFMMFVGTARSALFDQRLVRAGYPRSCLALAKCTALLMITAVVAAYTTGWMRLFWRPEQSLVLAAGMFSGALVYGGVGIVLAAVVRSELAGMFLAIMISSIDLVLQNPLINPAADSPVVRFLPAYAAVQTSVAAAGLQVVPVSCLLLGSGWAVGVAALGMAAFTARTRSHHPPVATNTAATDVEQTAPVP
ncbi:ABC transporter permease [Streptacidiphilus pinicola]|uniref:ABC transporter permease n=1 Tax=Streptacidiphilus pinicola TaxID=2219663 RepID=A0A2X0J2B1_9ACTN|nr:ABC transporter permease [Streptacidiphilus pinicola]RAG84326.1 ABC transporter permease [Streptacidiphilus pinicola]